MREWIVVCFGVCFALIYPSMLECLLFCIHFFPVDCSFVCRQFQHWVTRHRVRVLWASSWFDFMTFCDCVPTSPIEVICFEVKWFNLFVRLFFSPTSHRPDWRTRLFFHLSRQALDEKNQQYVYIIVESDSSLAASFPVSIFKWP